MNYNELIEGELLTFEESQYKGEYVAKWQGYTVAVVSDRENSLYPLDVLYKHPDGVSDHGQEGCSSLDEAWRKIKHHTATTFSEDLEELEEEEDIEEEQHRSRGLHR